MNNENGFQKIKNVITDQLVATGWVAAGERYSNTYIVATKGFETAVGTKEAVVFIQPYTKIVAKLSGVYYSEGRNILSTTWFDIKPDTSTIEIASDVAAFAAEVEAAVDASYAVKVLRKTG